MCQMCRLDNFYLFEKRESTWVAACKLSARDETNSFSFSQEMIGTTRHNFPKTGRIHQSILALYVYLCSFSSGEIETIRNLGILIEQDSELAERNLRMFAEIGRNFCLQYSLRFACDCLWRILLFHRPGLFDTLFVQWDCITRETLHRGNRS